MAAGRGEFANVTVPAINVRAMAYDTRPRRHPRREEAERQALIFEIARSEIGYTEQRPHEYAAVCSAPRCARDSRARSSSRAITCRPTRRNTEQTADKEIAGLRALIKQEIAAGFYNIDIDTSTLVDLDKPTLDEQQEVNFNLAADFTPFIRGLSRR